VHYNAGSGIVAGSNTVKVHTPEVRELVGVDMFIYVKENRIPQVIGDAVRTLDGNGLKLKLMSNRGQKIYPVELVETLCTDHWRCRFFSSEGEGKPISPAQIVDLLSRFTAAGYDFIKMENLYTFDGKAGYTAVQGE